ncbi:MAG: WD40/YVTN/BNR-like repeat-containing protein, partial [Armatimonadota bacterium]
MPIVSMLLSASVALGQPTGAPGVPVSARPIRWEPIGLGGGGAYMCIAVAPSNPKVIYVGGDVGGVWKSEDGGQSWRIRNGEAVHEIFPRETYNCSRLAVHPTDENIAYAGMTRGLLRTRDGARTWEVLCRDNRAKNALVLDPERPETIYCGAQHDSAGPRLFVSRDGGDTWRRLGTGLPAEADVTSVVIDSSSPVGNRTLYVGTTQGVFRGDGQRFVDISAGLRHRSVAKMAGGLAPTGRRFVLYAALATVEEDGGYSGGMFRTDDSGQTWREVTPGKFRSGERRTGKLGPITVRPNNADVVHAAAQAVYYFRSEDGGETWAEVSVGTGNADFKSVAGAADHFYWSWGSRQIALHPTEPRTVYSVGGAAGVFRSDDAGDTWEALTATRLRDDMWRMTGISNVYLDMIAIDPRDPRRIYMGDDDWWIYRSEDGGDTFTYGNAWWNREGDSLYVYKQNGFKASGGAPCIVVDPDRPSHVYAALLGWKPYRIMDAGDGSGGTLVLSRDCGKTWEPLGAPGSGLPEGSIWGRNGIAIDRQSPVDSRTIYAASLGNGVFKTVDGGKTWSDASLGLPTRWVTSIVMDPRDRRRLLVGIGKPKGSDEPGGIYETADAARSWRRLNVTDLPDVRYYVEVDPEAPDTVYAIVNECQVAGRA